MIILIDDLTPATNSADLTDPTDLIPASPHSAVLVTSRHDVPDLIARTGAHVHNLGPLPAGAALDLLSQYAGDRAGTDQDVLKRLCHRAGGHAHTLALLGAYLALHPTPAIGFVSDANR